MSNEALLSQVQTEGGSPALVQVLRKLLACACSEGGTGSAGGDIDASMAAFVQIAPTTLPGDDTDHVLMTLTFAVPGDAPLGTLLDLEGWLSGVTDASTALVGSLRVSLNGGAATFLAQARDETPPTSGGSLNLFLNGVLPVSAGDVVVATFHASSNASAVIIEPTPGDAASTDGWLIARYARIG